MSELNNKVVRATKWSALTEIMSKLITPISTMVLARLLTPDAFGVLTTVTMVISFAEIFTDAGFQKYLIQKQFDSEESLYKYTTVAFWSNLTMSIVIWIGIIIFSAQLAHLVGNDGYGMCISVSCLCIPLAAFSSIQMALYKRNLDYKSLFIRRIVIILIPLTITIPLAFFTRSYWALIVGLIVRDVANAYILTSMSKWKPKFYYSFSKFKDMFSFTVWSMIEAVSIWITSYVGVFIIGMVLSTHYIGIYKTGITTVNHIMGLVTAATTPVLFSGLSRLQNEDSQFKNLFFGFQHIVGLFVLPFGVGIFLFRDLITDILLGYQWRETSYLIGWWGLTSAVTIVLSHYSSEVYRAKGKPKYSVLVQLLHLLFLVPTVLLSVKYGFQSLCLFRSLVRLTLIVINMMFLYKLVQITPWHMIRNISHSIIGVSVMCLAYLFMPETNTMVVRILEIISCVIIYILIIAQWKDDRKILLNFRKKILKK